MTTAVVVSGAGIEIENVDHFAEALAPAGQNKQVTVATPVVTPPSFEDGYKEYNQAKGKGQKGSDEHVSGLVVSIARDIEKGADRAFFTNVCASLLNIVKSDDPWNTFGRLAHLGIKDVVFTADVVVKGIGSTDAKQVIDSYLEAFINSTPSSKRMLEILPEEKHHELGLCVGELRDLVLSKLNATKSRFLNKGGIEKYEYERAVELEPIREAEAALKKYIGYQADRSAAHAARVAIFGTLRRGLQFVEEHPEKFSRDELENRLSETLHRFNITQHDRAPRFMGMIDAIANRAERNIVFPIKNLQDDLYSHISDNGKDGLAVLEAIPAAFKEFKAAFQSIKDKLQREDGVTIKDLAQFSGKIEVLFNKYGDQITPVLVANSDGAKAFQEFGMKASEIADQLILALKKKRA